MEQANIRATLEAKHRELLGGIGSREDIRIENAADPFDNLQLQMNREVVIRTLDSDSALLRQISGALQRLEEGTFGICLECEEEIPARRLQVLPWAAHCVSCQEKADRRAAQVGDAFWTEED
ncbi:MAG TPA: TraR/DksA family transcriptional regulator [Bryobacteraceae bacterium]|nr:TraR/DksA family transcriptional regulator [Bryobacteraceae bacterium]